MVGNRWTDRLSKKKSALVAGVFALILLAIAGVYLVGMQGANETVRGSALDFWGKTPKLLINGQERAYNTRITNYLFLGTDQRSGESNLKVSGRNNGQADFILLLSVDHQNKSARSLQIDRDTMAEIIVLSVMGEESGKRNAQICLSHSFGQNEAESSSLTARAVSTLLCKVPIAHIVSVNMDKIGRIADHLGGIPVVLDQDYPTIDSRFVAGEKIVLKGDLANRFVRQRMDVDDGSNASRMARHQLFLDGLMDILASKAREDSKNLDRFYNFLSPEIFTTMTKGGILNLSKQLMDYSVAPLARLDGTHEKNSNGYIEFYPDRDKMAQLVENWFVNEASF